MTRSETLFQAAQLVMPGGVNSPVRACRAVGTYPRFLSEGRGSHVTDVDGNEYIDLICSWGPLILGHCHQAVEEAVLEAVRHGLSFGAPTEIEVKMAELVTKMTGTEMVRMVNSGTEAVMSAVRLARGATGRDKILKFEGCYHGHSDCMLVKAGSSAVEEQGKPSSAGVPVGTAQDTLTAPFNDLAAVEELFHRYPGAIACVIVEPVAANMGVVGPDPGFLEGLRALCDKEGALLIFDEVITGFRLAEGGAQAYFGVKADIVTFGKIIGGGMPVGAYAGSRALMEQVAPCGPVYQAGTLSGNPVAMAAGLAQLRYLHSHPEVYTTLSEKASYLADGLRKAAAATGAPMQINQVGSLVAPFFTPDEVHSFASATKSDLKKYAAYFEKMLHWGIYLAPAQFEAMFVSYAHSVADLDETIQAARNVFAQL